MANAEASPGNLGPRYAPDDPTLPEPWKGLIDGSTGSMYYWNPETNITQYEKPASLAPSLSHGPPPAVSTPKMNPLPSQPDGVQTPQNQHMSSSYYQQSQVGPTTQQPGQVRPQMMQQPSQHMPLQSGKQFPMHQTPYQQMQQMPHVQQGQMYPGAQMGSQHGFQFPGQHTQYMGYQQNMPQQGQQSSSQQMPHIQEYKMEHGQRDDKDFHQVKQQGFSQAHRNSMQGQHYPHPQDQKSGIPQRDNVEFQQGNQPGFSPAQIQQTGMPSASLPAGANSHIQPNRTVEYNASSANVQQNKSSLTHLHHGSMFQNQLSSGIIRGQQQNLPPAGSKMLHEEIHHGRPGNEYSYNNSKNVNAMSPQLPKLAALPTNRNQLEVRVGDFPSQNPMPSLPGRLNGPGGHALPVYDNYSGPPSYQNNAFVRPPVAMMRPSDPIHLSSADYRQKHEVTVTGENVPAPFMSFEDTGFPPEILYELRDAGFSAPTPIQAQSWPIAIQNRDIVAIAKTGSGKTLGYMIPAFIHLSRRRNNPQHGPTVIVLAPTRELATQIQDEAIKFGRSSRVSCTCLYGGAPKGPQLKELERGADIVVATPGRLNDILEMRKIDFRQVSLLVLDEADRMLDMGFEPQIRKIVNEIPPRRQTLMYTATWPKEVRKIASDLLINPVQVNIGSEDLSANKSITQFVEVVPDYLKQRRLDQILQSQERGSKIIIFCSTKKLCDHVERVVGRTFPAAAIHGDKSQIERDSVLNQFRSGKSPVLVATDVAARGLDIRDIRVVINYDFPTGIEDYIHRIGRTGRAGATGLAYTFISEHDCKYAPDLVKVLEGANQAVPPEVRELASRAGSRFPKDRGGPMNHYDSGGSGRGGFGGRGGMREGGFAVRGGMRDRNFGGGREVGFNSLDARGRGGWDRGGRGGPNGRFNSLDARGRGGGRGRGRGRFDSRRDSPDRRSRGRSRSRSSERVRTWDYSRSRSRSYSRSRSRSRSWSRSRSPRRDRSRSRSRSYERYERKPRVSKFDVMEVSAPNVGVLPEGVKGNEVESIDQVPAAVSVDRGHTGAGLDLNNATLQP